MSAPASRLPPAFLASYDELVGSWRRKLGNSHDAEDVAQETLLRALQADASSVQQPRAWLHQTARNLVTDLWRRRGHAQAWAAEQPADPSAREPACDASNPEQLLQATQLHARLELALAELPLKCRQVFVLQRLDGLGQAEIAERMGLTRNSVEKYMIRAMRHLRERLIDADGLPR